MFKAPQILSGGFQTDPLRTTPLAEEIVRFLAGGAAPSIAVASSIPARVWSKA
jgi:hypothetical protein